MKRGLGSLTLVLTASLLSSACSATPKGALMLSISTDMQTPKDVDVVSLFVATDGVANFDYLGRVLPDGSLSLPSTLALVQPDNPNAQVHIRVTAFQAQGTQENARVVRDVLTTVPTARTALLRLPLDFLDDGSGQGTLPAQYVPEGEDGAPEGLTQFDPTTIGSSCDPMKLCTAGSTSCQTMVNGVCTGATVNSAMLPAFTQSEVFGDGGLMASGAPESCLDVPTCFQNATPVTGIDMTTCSFVLPGALGGGDASPGGSEMQPTDAGQACTLDSFTPNSPDDAAPPVLSETETCGAHSYVATCVVGDPDASVQGVLTCTDNGAEVQPMAASFECGAYAVYGNCGAFVYTDAGAGSAFGGRVISDCLAGCGFPAAVPPIDAGAPADATTSEKANLAASDAGPGATLATAGMLNLAFVTPTTGACLSPGQCYDPLPNDPNEGWTLHGNTVQFTPGVCLKLGSTVTLAMSSGLCPTETPSEPVCEPASMEPSEAGAEQGGAFSDASSSKTGGDATTAGSDATTAASEGGLPAGNFVGIMAGEYHTCAWDQAGDVSCWGENEYGEYGSGNSPGSTTPTPAATGVTVTAMAGGNDNTCAVTTAGAVECWGYGQYGDLGNGSTTGSLTPVAVTGLSSGAVSVAMGYDMGCALTTAGAVECWGDGLLGSGTNTMSTTPVQVTGLTSGVARIAAGLGHACAVTTAGALVCWGNDDGDPDGGSASVPEPVSGMSSGVAAVALGQAHVCALTAAGTVSCWGSNQYGQLGNGAPLDNDAAPASSLVPVPVSGLPSNIASIGSGYNHACAVTAGGAALCWGDNANGQLGDGTTTSSSVPVPVTGLSSGVARIVGGNNYTCALTTLGGVLCWGSNAIAQFQGAFDYGSVPVDVFNP